MYISDQIILLTELGMLENLVLYESVNEYVSLSCGFSYRKPIPLYLQSIIRYKSSRQSEAGYQHSNPEL